MTLAGTRKYRFPAGEDPTARIRSLWQTIEAVHFRAPMCMPFRRPYLIENVKKDGRMGKVPNEMGEKPLAVSVLELEINSASVKWE
ncbi:hypothetical protein BHE74_00024264 [Ensete ventricosum]|nr:hypothetical protein BHE74_00024264 [Ensete ventricosum]RZR94376.1 hypothetical protein BHM03_00023069 [Ensete ventricosum]